LLSQGDDFTSRFGGHAEGGRLFDGELLDGREGVIGRGAQMFQGLKRRRLVKWSDRWVHLCQGLSQGRGPPEPKGGGAEATQLKRGCGLLGSLLLFRSLFRHAGNFPAGRGNGPWIINGLNKQRIIIFFQRPRQIFS